MSALKDRAIIISHYQCKSHASSSSGDSNEIPSQSHWIARTRIGDRDDAELLGIYVSLAGIYGPRIRLHIVSYARQTSQCGTLNLAPILSDLWLDLRRAGSFRRICGAVRGGCVRDGRESKRDGEAITAATGGEAKRDAKAGPVAAECRQKHKAETGGGG